MVNGDQSHAEAAAEVEIGGEKNGEVGVVTATVPEDEAKSAEVMSEDAMTAGTETEREGEAGAQADGVETTIEKDGAEVATGTERGGGVRTVKILGEEAARKREEVARRTDHAADE